MNLGLVIPVRNDQAALDRLLGQARALGVFEQVLVVDDGSDPAITLPDDSSAELIRQDRPRGAGAARNAAIPAIATSHVLFFDSDDLLTPELPPLWRALAGRDFDFCLFAHADSRVVARGGWDQMPHDAALWHCAGLGGAALCAVSGAALLPLAETANYPWNKIYRSDFLRAHGLRCAETRVHNDIPLHWLSFLAADRILVSSRIAAVHHVAAGKGRLTDRRGAERLALFEALEPVRQALETAPPGKEGLRLAFLRFVSGLLIWVRDHLDPAHHAALQDRTRAFLRAAIAPDTQAQLIRQDPVLALRLALQMAGGHAPC